MSRKLAYERYYWFHGQIKAGRFPNARTLSEKFEISQKQAQRDIEFIRDRLGAPLLYSFPERGYKYEDVGYELPPVWFKEDELLSLCLALRLAATLPDHVFKDSLNSLLTKILAFRLLDSSPSIEEIKEKVSVKNIEYYRVDEPTFHHVVDSLLRDEPLRISYYTPHRHEISDRTIQPLHLLCYMGSWHIIAFCTLKNGLRDFALSRIQKIEPSTGPIIVPRHLCNVKDFLGKNFGVMSGRESIEVCLRFDPAVADWISEQIWHSGQEVSINGDGSVCLKFPVADFREVRREILKYGANVEVLSPPELREDIRKQIEKMAKIYV